MLKSCYFLAQWPGHCRCDPKAPLPWDLLWQHRTASPQTRHASCWHIEELHTPGAAKWSTRLLQIDTDEVALKAVRYLQSGHPIDPSAPACKLLVSLLQRSRESASCHSTGSSRLASRNKPMPLRWRILGRMSCLQSSDCCLTTGLHPTLERACRVAILEKLSCMHYAHETCAATSVPQRPLLDASQADVASKYACASTSMTNATPKRKKHTR